MAAASEEKQLRVLELFKACESALDLRQHSSQTPSERLITQARQDGERLPLLGQLNLITPNRIQLIGSNEWHYLGTLSTDELQSALQRIRHPACRIILLSDDLPLPSALYTLTQTSGLVLWYSPHSVAHCMATLRQQLDSLLSESTLKHGVLLDVSGIGVLLTGESGAGKSEVALELISRGHCLIADDAVHFVKTHNGAIEGHCPAMLRDFLEVRGLGILNIRKMYGDASTRYQKRLSLIVHLEPWHAETVQNLDRLQGQYNHHTILGVDIMRVTIPVAPGRNLAALLETAVRQFMLLSRGYNSADDFCQRQQQQINQQS